MRSAIQVLKANDLVIDRVFYLYDVLHNAEDLEILIDEFDREALDLFHIAPDLDLDAVDLIVTAFKGNFVAVLHHAPTRAFKPFYGPTMDYIINDAARWVKKITSKQI